MSHTALVNVDAAVSSKLIAFVAELTGDAEADFTAQCNALSQPSELLQILLTKTDLILALENEKDAEGCFQAMIAVLNSDVSSNDDEARFIQSMISSLTASDKHVTVLNVLVSAFNLLRSSSSKFQVLKALFSYATKSGNANLVSNFESRVSVWVSKWGLKVQEQRELFLLTAETLFANDHNSRALFFLTQFLATFNAGETYAQEVVEVATRAVVCAVKAPVSFHKDRNDLSKTISGHVTSDATLLKLIELLRIFCTGTVEEYTNFHGSNKDLFAKHDICHETSLKNMRLMGLCVLAARSTTSASSSQVLAYSDIAKALEVSSDEDVEEWVVEAISHGLLDATMDQLNSAIVVSRCVRVSFEHDEWVALQEKLNAWKNNLSSVLDVMKNHQKSQQ